ncbi:glycoside hydrolase family 3 C-terminal domain-containing protein [Simiduia sp. 21SJ11W-1]|nr:glycoside hydrolase family 3 C-terminal domain-containing protein [Simiduia sp. 21SJ11W-1]
MWPALTPAPHSPEIEARIDALLPRLSLEQKVGQIIQPEIRHVNAEDVREYYLGSVLNGGGSFPSQNKYASPNDWLALADSFYQGSMSVDAEVKIPILWGTDAVHGHNNVIGATLFPHNIALGAAHNPELMRHIGAVTAKEMAATGITWSFAPTLAVARDDRWGRTYESYSETPELVAQYATAMVEGLQGARAGEQFLADGKVISTAKHFIADGGTTNGIDRGDTRLGEQQLIDIHAPGYFAAIEAGVQVIMASFSSWNGDKLHGHEYLLNDVLKKRLGFDGFIVGDWAGHAFVPGCTDTHCPAAINAGLDMFMAPDGNWRELYKNTLADVKAGRISEARLNDAVRRILRVKMRAKLFERGKPSSYALAAKAELIGAPEHRAIARQAVRESVVLLKNHAQLLPLAANSRLLVAGDGAHNLGKQTGGWTISWQGTGNMNEDFPGATTIYDGIKAAVELAGGQAHYSEDGSYTKKPDAAIVVFGENPYAEMQGDVEDLAYRSAKDLALLEKFSRENIPVVALFITGRPLAVNPFLNASDAFAVIWQPGTEGAGVADVLIQKPDGSINFPFTGKLSFSWPTHGQQTPLNAGDGEYQPLFARGFGLTNGQQSELHYPLAVAKADVAVADTRTQAIFHRRTFAPWTLQLKGTNGVATDLNGASLKVPGLSLQMRDRFVQEDTVRLQWQAPARAGFYSPTPQDLSEFAGGTLVFDLQVAEARELAIQLACEQCQARNLADFARLDRNQWQQVRIPLACLTEDLATVAGGFEITGSKNSEVWLYNIHLEKGEHGCPKP